MSGLIGDEIEGVYAAVSESDFRLIIWLVYGELADEREIGRRLVGLKTKQVNRCLYNQMCTEVFVEDSIPIITTKVEVHTEHQDTSICDDFITHEAEVHDDNEDMWKCKPNNHENVEKQVKKEISTSMVLSGFKTPKANMSLNSFFKKLN